VKTPLERAATLVEQQYKRNQEAVQLAKLASLAVRIESHLLRRLRLELLPDADVGIEADLWFGPLVESRGVRVIVLNRYVVELLREKLAEDGQLLRRVIVLTEQAHAASAPTIRLEERLTALAVLNEPDAQQQIDEALRPALRTMQLGGDDARKLAQWAMRALSQAHRSVRESPNAIALGLSATLALGARPILREVPKLPGDLGDLTWLLRGAISGSPKHIGVELVAGGVAFAEPGGGQPQLELPATNPLLLSLAWKTEEGDATMLVEVAPGRTVELDADVTQVELRTLSGDEYLLTAVASVESSAETTNEDQEVRHFDIDVFISYAHVDNEDGWVTVLQQLLRRLLNERLGREVNTWMDQKFSGGEGFADEATGKLSQTAVMVSILSPAYLHSEWCVNEVNKFCELAEQNGGLVTDNRSRVLKVIKLPIDFDLTEKLPPGVRDTVGYTFFTEEEGLTKTFEPNSDLAAKIRAALKMHREDIAAAYIRELHEAHGDQDFLRVAGVLANDIAQMLSRLSGEPLPPPPAKKISGIFVSYRRSDSEFHAGRLFDKLVKHFGKDRIFMDVKKILPGQDWGAATENAIDSCEILIAIIGPRWLEELHDRFDQVHLEIAHALSRGTRVVPVLVQGASMPRSQDLPDDLAKLARLNAIELVDSRWKRGSDRLISIMERVLAEQKGTDRRRFGLTDPELPTDISEEERRQHNDARRFARLLVSEIKLYNEAKLKEGRSENNLYAQLREYIDKSRLMYNKRVAPVVAVRHDYFHQELVNTLAEGDIERMGADYPGPNLIE